MICARQGQKVGLIKIRCYRPFPYEEILEALKGAKVAAVMEASFSMGSEGSIGLDLKAKLCGRPGAPHGAGFHRRSGWARGEQGHRGPWWSSRPRAKSPPSGRPLDEPVWVDLNRDILP